MQQPAAQLAADAQAGPQRRVLRGNSSGRKRPATEEATSPEVAVSLSSDGSEQETDDEDFVVEAEEPAKSRRYLTGCSSQKVSKAQQGRVGLQFVVPASTLVYATCTCLRGGRRQPGAAGVRSARLLVVLGTTLGVVSRLQCWPVYGCWLQARFLEVGGPGRGRRCVAG